MKKQKANHAGDCCACRTERDALLKAAEDFIQMLPTLDRRTLAGCALAKFKAEVAKIGGDQ